MRHYEYGNRGRMYYLGFRNSALGLALLLITNIAIRMMA